MQVQDAGCAGSAALPSSDLASADNVALAGVVVWARPSTLAFNRRPQLIASGPIDTATAAGRRNGRCSFEVFDSVIKI